MKECKCNKTANRNVFCLIEFSYDHNQRTYAQTGIKSIRETEIACYEDIVNYDQEGEDVYYSIEEFDILADSFGCFTGRIIENLEVYHAKIELKRGSGE